MANDMHDIDDVERLMPGFLTATREWFRLYKVPDGEPPNDFAFDGKYRYRQYVPSQILTDMICLTSIHLQIRSKHDR